MFPRLRTRRPERPGIGLLALALCLAGTARAGTEKADFRLPEPPSAYLDRPASELVPMMAWTEVQLHKLEGQDKGIDRDVALGRGELEVELLLLQGRHAEVLPVIERIRKQSDKPQLRGGLLLVEELLAQAQAEAWSPEQFKAAYVERLEALPWPASAQPLRLQQRALPSRFDKDVLQGQRVAWQMTVDPLAAGGSLDVTLAVAQRLIDFRYQQDVVVPMTSALRSAMASELARHDVGDAFWSASDYRPPTNGGQPVSILVWEPEGVDLGLFKHPDDACLAFPTAATCLVDPVIQGADHAAAWRFVKGWQDEAAGIESAEQLDFWRYSRGLAVDQGAQAHMMAAAKLQGEVFDAVSRIHGTHVAGIAMKGNPYAQLVAIDDQQMAVGGNDARAQRFARIADFIRAHHVRVVNMSWGMQAGMMAPEQLADLEMRMKQLFAQSPDTLFVAGAGNDDNSTEGRRVVPASLEAPNLITVGAVDRAGQVANFSNTGQVVAIYANGDNVESLMPGGLKARMSGTSMAAPQVVNLAAKLLSQRPALTAVQLKQLILDGADKIAAGSQTEAAMRLLDPRKSAALAGLATPDGAGHVAANGLSNELGQVH